MVKGISGFKLLILAVMFGFALVIWGKADLQRTAPSFNEEAIVFVRTVLFPDFEVSLLAKQIAQDNPTLDSRKLRPGQIVVVLDGVYSDIYPVEEGDTGGFLDIARRHLVAKDAKMAAASTQ
jgi:hypothetical protein